MKNNLTKKDLNIITYNVLGAAIKVHKALGPGLLESVYHRCLFYEMNKQNILFKSSLNVPVIYDGLVLDADLRCDFFVDSCLVVELKAVDMLAPIFESQLLTYMKLLNAPKGILINFNSRNLFKDGQRTLVNELFRILPDE
jgi:GxxExxY protein